jgi:predicted lysophospholipase L1 biosynthesis ABC-type transport system permease subunit
VKIASMEGSACYDGTWVSQRIAAGPSIRRPDACQTSRLSAAIVLTVTFGIAGAAVLTHQLTSMLFDVKAADMVTFISAAALFFMVSLAASYIPARRAAAIEPMAALRDS